MFNTDFFVHVEDFILSRVSKNVSTKTINSYEGCLKLFGQYLQDELNITEVAKIKPAHVRRYVKYLTERGKYTVTSNGDSLTVNVPQNRNDYKKPLSKTTIANYLRYIKVFFNYLHNEGLINKNPTANIPNIKPDRKKKPILSRHEIVRLLRAFDLTTFHGYRNWLCVRLMLDTGMRVSECLALKPEHFDFKNKAILVTNPKDKRVRFVYFSSKMHRDIRRWMLFRDRYTDSEYMFPTTRGTLLDAKNFGKLLKMAGERAGVKAHPHQLRNSFAKYYLLNGGDWATLSRILGHSNASVTQEAYLDFTDDEVGRKYQRHSPITLLDV